MTAKQARDNFTDLLGRVYYGKESVVVERKGRPFAVVISPESFERYKKAMKEEFFKIVDEIQSRNAHFTEDEVMKDITQAVEEVRQELYDKAKKAEGSS